MRNDTHQVVQLNFKAVRVLSTGREQQFRMQCASCVGIRTAGSTLHPGTTAWVADVRVLQHGMFSTGFGPLLQRQGKASCLRMLFSVGSRAWV